MFRYPAEDNLITRYFALVTQVYQAQDKLALAATVLDIKKYKNMIDQFVVKFKEEEQLRESFDKFALFQCESDLLTCLTLIYDRKLSQFVNIDENEAKKFNTESLAYLSKLNRHSPNPLIWLLNLSMIISADILSLSDMVRDHPNDDMESKINKIQIICENIYEFFHKSNQTIYEAIENISEKDFLEIQTGMKIMLQDKMPNSKPEEFGFLLVNLFIDLIVEVRHKLEESKQSKIKLLKIDAVLCRLNLIKHSEYRVKFQKHIQLHHHKYLGESRLTDRRRPLASVISSLIDNSANSDVLQKAVQLLLNYVEKCELLFSSYMLRANDIKESKKELPALKEVLLTHLDNVEFDARIILKQVYSHIPSNDCEYTNMNMDLQMIINMVEVMMEYIDPIKAIAMRDKYFNIEVVEIARVKTDGLACAMGLVLHAELKCKLNQAPTIEARMKIIKKICKKVNLLIDQSSQLTRPVHDPSTQVYRQFVLDYYYSSVLLCRTSDELLMLNSDELIKRIKQLWIGLENFQLYRFIQNCFSRFTFNDEIYNPYDSDHFKTYSDKILIALMIDAAWKTDNVEATYKSNSIILNYCFNRYKLLINHVMSKPDENLKIMASSLQIKLDRYHKLLEGYIKNIVDHLSDDRLPQHPVTLRDVAASFVTVKPKVKQGNGKNKKTQKQKTKTSTKQIKLVSLPNKPLTLESSFYEVKIYYKNELSSILSFYHNGKSNRDSKLRVYAYVGLAECLAMQSAKSKRDKLGAELQAHSKQMSHDCASLYPENVFTPLLKRYHELVEQWQASVIKIVPIIESKPSEKTTPVIEQKAKPASNNVKVSKKSLFNDKHARPNVKPEEKTLPVLKNISSSLPVPLGMRIINRKLDIKYEESQWELINLLKKYGLSPKIHGGAVINTLFGLPCRDIDVLCFAERNQLVTLLMNHSKSLNITLMRPNIKSNVYVLKFGATVDRKESELEILYLPLNGLDKESRIKELARQYGINFTLYYDPFEHVILDPLNQFDRITVQRTIDVCQVCHLDINHYFYTHPDRIFDCIIKVSMFAKHNIQISLSDDVHKAILAANNAGFNKIHMSKLDKLFILGHALQSFDRLDHEFKLIPIMFPMIHTTAYADFRLTCYELDEMFNHPTIINGPLSNIDLRRLWLFNRILYPIFYSTHEAMKLHEEKIEFYTACKKFINQTIFYISDAFLNLLQDSWWKQLLHENILRRQYPSSRM